MKLLCLDCDSTLSGIEGVDELARLRGQEVFDEVVMLTNRAMDGEFPLAEVFPRRMEMIRPSRQDCEAVGKLYLEHLAPDVLPVLNQLRVLGWQTVIVSGGFVPCIQPLARALGIERVEAVPLFFDGAGGYAGYDASYPATRNGGKPEIVTLLQEHFHPEITVIVGDGASDAEARAVADRFIGCAIFVNREKVMAMADSVIHHFSDLLKVLPA